MPSFERRFALHVPSSTENLALIRDFVSAIGAQVGFDENEIARLALAVDEACANVIEHAYGSDDTREVTVRAAVEEGGIHFDVIDNGRNFDPSLIKPQSVEEAGQATSQRWPRPAPDPDDHGRCPVPHRARRDERIAHDQAAEEVAAPGGLLRPGQNGQLRIQLRGRR